MAVVARLTKTGQLQLAGQVVERTPVVYKDLLANYPFDETLNHIKKLKGAKVAGYFLNSQGHPCFTWFQTNSGSFTQITDWSTFDLTQAKQYDLIVYDAYAWSVDPTVIDKLKMFVDNGVSCVATGNDTRTNVFVKTYNTSGTKQDHNILIEPDLPFTTKMTTYSGGFYDLIGGIVALQNGAYPFYRRADTNLITGYIYESPISGAVLIFDQEGMNIQEFHIAAFEYALGRSIANIKNADSFLTLDGLSVHEATTNMLSFSPTQYANDLNFENPTLYKSNSDWRIELVYDKDAVNNIALEIEALRDMTAWEVALSLDVIPFTDNSTKFSFSIRYKVLYCDDNPNGLVAHNWLAVWSHWRRDSGLSDITEDYVFHSGTVTTEQDWKIYKSTMTSPSANTTGKHFYIGTGSVKRGTKFRIDWIQFEKKDFTTAFVKNSRGNASVDIPVELGNTDFTIFTWVKFARPIDGTHPSNARYMWITGSHAFGLRFWIHPQGRVHPWIDADSWSQPHNHAHFGITYPADTWYPSVVIRQGSKIYWRIYMNGTKYEWCVNVTPSQSFNKIQLIHETNPTFKDLAIYNRALTDEEINRLIKPSLTIDKDGNLYGAKVIEQTPDSKRIMSNYNGKDIFYDVREKVTLT